MRWLSDTTVARLREAADWPDLTGTRYTAIEQIGQGGMASVFRVHDTVLDRDCAMKVVRLPDDASGVGTRLRLESRILAGLEHPGIVPVHDAGALPDGRPFYVMKFVRGRRLDAVVHDGVDLAERLRIFERICEAVAFAHARGVIHRDLKPENVMTGAYGEVLVLDWGIARVIADAAAPGTDTGANAEASSGGAAPITSHGMVLGTPGYMAPEQERGTAAGVGPSADVYALGGILWFLLTGAPPSVEPVAETVAVPAGVPPRLAAIVRKARSADPAGRYPDVASVAADVRLYLEGRAVGAYRESPWDRLVRVARRHRTAIFLVLAYLVLRVLILIFGGR